MLNSRNAWMAVYGSPHFFSFADSFFSIVGHLSCILPVYTDCAPLRLLMRLLYLSKKKENYNKKVKDKVAL
jgi:hypothetical protein